MSPRSCRNPQFLRHLFAIEAEHKVALGWFDACAWSTMGDGQGVVNLKLRGTPACGRRAAVR
jgi:hypothetical protein